MIPMTRESIGSKGLEAIRNLLIENSQAVYKWKCETGAFDFYYITNKHAKELSYLTRVKNGHIESIEVLRIHEFGSNKANDAVYFKINAVNEKIDQSDLGVRGVSKSMLDKLLAALEREELSKAAPQPSQEAPSTTSQAKRL